MKRILAICNNTSDLNVEWQAESFKESETDDIRIVEGSSLEILDEEIQKAAKDNISDLVVLWEKKLQREAEEEYGSLFESLVFEDRQFILREGDPSTATGALANANSNAAKATPQEKEPDKPKTNTQYNIFVVNPINAVVAGSVTLFPELVKQFEEITNTYKDIGIHIFDTCDDPKTNWMYGQALSCIESGYANAGKSIASYVDVGKTFSDYKNYEAFCITTYKSMNNCWVVVPQNSSWTGTNVIKSGTPITIPGKQPITITLVSSDGSKCQQALALGKEILEDVEKKKVSANDAAVKKWLGDASKKKKTIYLSSTILTMLKDAVSGEATKTLNKTHKENNEELKKKISEFCKTMGFSDDWDTAGKIVDAAGGAIFKDALKAGAGLLKGMKKDNPDKDKDESKNGTVVSHANWEKFQSLFDDQMQGSGS